MTADGSAHRAGPLRKSAHGAHNLRRAPLPWPLGMIAQPVYRAVINSRNRAFDAGRGVVRFDRVVISVGNLSVGGTGKTPMVAQIVRWLQDAGHRPVIAMRGYNAGKRNESDEAAIYKRSFPDIPIVARANRTFGLIKQFEREYEADPLQGRSPLHADAGDALVTDRCSQRSVPASQHPPTSQTPFDLAEAIELARAEKPNEHSDCIILDDGFQHRQIARDFDIVLIDLTRSPFEDRLLPAGWLREPVDSLKRASAIILTHAESIAHADITALDRQFAQLRGRSADAIARHDWRSLIVLESSNEREHPTTWLAARRAFAVCAIGNPGAFIRQAQRTTGLPLAGELILRDHDPYSESTIRRLIENARAAGAQAIITTEKDWSKLARIRPEAWPCPLARVQLHMTFDRGGEDLRQRILSAVAAGAPE